MDVLIYSAFQLFGDCLECCLAPLDDVHIVAVVRDDSTLRGVLDRISVDLLLIDVASGIQEAQMSAIFDDYPGVISLALGLPENDVDVIRCGRAGFAGYVPQESSLQTLAERMRSCVSGRLQCSETTAASLLRALRRSDKATVASDLAMSAGTPRLSYREVGVVRLLRQGFSNKEIARELQISVATVKHHVHSILDKLGLPGRVHVARAEPDDSWGLDNQSAARPRLVRRS